MTQPPATPTLPRLPHEVVPADDRDDPEIILSTTTVRTKGPRQISKFHAMIPSNCPYLVIPQYLLETTKYSTHRFKPFEPLNPYS